MRIKRYIFLITLKAIILSFTFSVPFYASKGGAAETYSFRFDNCTISEALREISQKSGITIILKSDINKTIQGKSYTNRTLDKIITDLLRGENCALVWNYSRGNLASIGLYTFDKDNKVNSRRSFTEIKPLPSPVNEVTGSSENLPIAHDVERANEDESREVAARYMIAREMERNEGTDNNLPDPHFSIRNRPMRRVDETGNAVVVPETTGESGMITPVSDTKPNDRIGEEVSVNTPEPPPGLPDEAAQPPAPETPDPASFNGLEPPPMPPGL
jgi:hypothetical protein